MAEDWTARGSLAGLDIEIRGGHADRGEYLVPVSYTHLTLPTNREV